MQIDCSIFLGSSGSNWLQTMDQYSNPGFWTITGKSPFKAPQAASLPWDNINSSHRDSSLVLLLNESHGVSPTPHAYRNSILVNPWEGQRLENTASVGAHSTILLGNTTREVTGPYRSAIEKLSTPNELLPGYKGCYQSWKRKHIKQGGWVWSGWSHRPSPCCYSKLEPHHRWWPQWGWNYSPLD